MKWIKVILALSLAAFTATSCGSHEKNCRDNGGVVHSQNVYDEKGNYDHSHYQCVTLTDRVIDEWDGK